MVTIAHITEEIIRKRPFLCEALSKEIINYGALADEIINEVESHLNKKVKHSAVMMALRRYSEKLNKSTINNLSVDNRAEIIIQSNMFEITIVKNNETSTTSRKIQSQASADKDFNLTYGNKEITIIANKKYEKKIKGLFKKKDIVNHFSNLATLTIHFSKEFAISPGFYYLILREIAWENINLTEIVSTATELTLILNENDIGNAFNVINKLIKK